MARVWPKVLRGAGGQAAVLPVACDRMLILALALPPMPKSQRRAAAAFAAESFVAEPLEDVQVVLGPKLDEGTYLAVVVGRHVFAGLLAEARDRRVPLVPEVLLLPRPVAGQWTVAERGGRILARRPDGTGFAAPEPAFRAIWAQSGVPGLVWVHGTPPEVLPLASRTALPFPLTPEPALAGFDLGEGLVPDWRQPRKLGALGAVLVLGLCGHLTLLARDGQRLAGWPTWTLARYGFAAG